MHHVPRRTTSSSLETTMSGQDRRARMARKRMLLHVGVGLTTLVIVALYAASARLTFRTNPEAENFDEMTEGFSALSAKSSESLKQLETVRDAIETVLNAKNAQAESINLMKAKLESATSTYEEKGQSATGTHP